MPTLAASPFHPGITFASGLAILEPENWPGQLLPLRPYLLPADNSSSLRDTPRDSVVNPISQIDTGQWTLIIYSNDCDHCRQLIPTLLQQAVVSPSRPLPLSPSWAFVELPPYAPPGEQLIPPTPGLLRLRLTAAHEWFVQTPILIHLQNGIVKQAKQGNEVTLSNKEPF